MLIVRYQRIIKILWGYDDNNESSPENRIPESATVKPESTTEICGIHRRGETREFTNSQIPVYTADPLYTSRRHHWLHFDDCLRNIILYVFRPTGYSATVDYSFNQR